MGWVSDSTGEKSLPLLLPQLPYISRFDVTRRKWRICCVNMTFDLLLIPYSIRMTVEAADDPLHSNLQRLRESFHPGPLGLGHCRWRGGEIEVYRVLRRDKHQNKMFLTARGV